MRPEIPEELERRANNVYEKAGYRTPTDLICDATRTRVAAIEEGGENPPLVALKEAETDGGNTSNKEGWGETDGESTSNKEGWGDPGGTRKKEKPDPEFENRNWRDEQGAIYGVNPANRAHLVVDRFGKRADANQLVAGDIGTGKTVSTKLHIKRALETYEKARVVYIDPIVTGESLAEAVDSQRIDIKSDSINLFSVLSQGDEDPHTINEKAEMIIQLIELLEGDHVIEDRNRDTAKSVAGRAIRNAIDSCSDEADPVTFTTIREHLAEMSSSPEQEAFPDSTEAIQTVEQTAQDLYMHTRQFSENGCLSAFGHDSTIDITDNRMTWFPFNDIVDPQNVQTAIYATVQAVTEQAKATSDPVIIAIDEAQYLLDYDVAEPLAQIMRHGRHDNVGFHLVTQTLEEVLDSQCISSIIEQCSVIQLHRMTGLSEETAAELGLSGPEAEYVRQGRPGIDGDSAESLLSIAGSWIPANVEIEEHERQAVLGEK